MKLHLVHCYLLESNYMPFLQIKIILKTVRKNKEHAVINKQVCYAFLMKTKLIHIFQKKQKAAK